MIAAIEKKTGLVLRAATEAEIAAYQAQPRRSPLWPLDAVVVGGVLVDNVETGAAPRHDNSAAIWWV